MVDEEGRSGLEWGLRILRGRKADYLTDSKTLYINPLENTELDFTDEYP